MIYGRDWGKLALAAALLISATQARASIIFNTLGPAGSEYDSNNFYSISGTGSNAGNYRARAMGFTPSSDAIVTEIDLAIALFSGTAPITVSLNSDAAGIPGAVIDGGTASWVLSGLTNTTSCPGACLNLVTISTSHALVGGTTYWVVARTTAAGDAYAGWFYSTPNLSMLRATDDGTGFVSVGRDTHAAALALSGTSDSLITSPTPEPSTIVLGGAGLLLVTVLRRRRRGTTAA